MAQLQPLPIMPPPGVVMTESRRVVEARWIDSHNMRFVKKLPQKIGGWVRAYAEATSGAPRALHAWRDNVSVQYLAAATYRKLYVYDDNLEQQDITPFSQQGTLGANPIDTVSGSDIVTVTDPGHGLIAGDTVYLSGASSVGGIDPNGVWVVYTVIDAGHYTFLAGTSASSTDTGGGSGIDYAYEINVGVEAGAYGYGWGIGGWGIGTWGTARPFSTIFIEPRIWSLDHFGQLLLASYNGGSIYKFDPTSSRPWGRAEVVDASAPDNCRAVFVTPERFVFALLDNMQVAWCSQGDYTIWTPAIGNTANIRTLTEGTKLVSGRVLADFVSLVWTDAALYRFQYTGSTYVYNSSMVAKDCGLIAPGAAVTAGGVAYWMGPDTFWMYDGAVRTMPNVEDIRDVVFKSLRTDYVYQATAVFVPKYNEVWFFYTETGHENPSAGLIYSIENQCWSPLDMGRVSGTHFTQGDTRPYMGMPDGVIMQHENGNDDDGAVLPTRLVLAPYAMAEGGLHMDCEYLVSDFKDQIGDISLTVVTWDRLNDTAPEDTASDVIEASDTGTIDLRVSGRHIGLVLETSSLGSHYRFGKPVAFVKQSGRRT